MQIKTSYSQNIYIDSFTCPLPCKRTSYGVNVEYIHKNAWYRKGKAKTKIVKLSKQQKQFVITSS